MGDQSARSGDANASPPFEDAASAIKRSELLLPTFGQAVEFADAARRERNRYYNVCVCFFALAALSVWVPEIASVIISFVQLDKLISAPINFSLEELPVLSRLLPKRQIERVWSEGDAFDNPWYDWPFYLLQALILLAGTYFLLAFQQRALMTSERMLQQKVLGKETNLALDASGGSAAQSLVLLGAQAESDPVRRFRWLAKFLNRSLMALMLGAYALGLGYASLSFLLAAWSDPEASWLAFLPLPLIILVSGVAATTFWLGLQARLSVNEAGKRMGLSPQSQQGQTS